MNVYFTLMRLITREDALSRCVSFKSYVEPAFYIFPGLICLMTYWINVQ